MVVVVLPTLGFELLTVVMAVGMTVAAMPVVLITKDQRGRTTYHEWGAVLVLAVAMVVREAVTAVVLVAEVWVLVAVRVLFEVVLGVRALLEVIREILRSGHILVGLYVLYDGGGDVYGQTGRGRSERQILCEGGCYGNKGRDCGNND